MFADCKCFFMKKIMFLLIASGFFACGFGQQNRDERTSDYGELKGGFKQENIFLGGGASLGGGFGQFSFGVSPEAGYSIAQWLDAGIGLNIIYTSVASNTYYNPTSTKLRQWNYGGGPFFRVYPVNFLFVQGQFEENWTKVTIKDGIYTYKQNENAASLIAGIGYTERVVGQGSYYVMLGLDLLNNTYSPYVTQNDYGQLRKLPILRAGFNFYLRPAKQKELQSRYQNARIL